jgi:hypothetical protein
MQKIVEYHPIPDYRGGMGVMLNMLLYQYTVEKNIYVDWTDNNIVYKSPEMGNNVFDYYFYNAELEKDAVFLDFKPDTLWHINYHINMNADTSINMKKLEILCNLYNKHIKMKEDILENADYFFQKNINGKSLGIQYRKTDKIREVRQISIDKFVEVIKNNLDKYDTIFIASDEADAVNKTKEMSDKIKYLDIIRCSDGKGLHYQQNDRELDNYLRGYECLMDMLILSKCSDFLYSRSNISLTTMILNQMKYDKMILLNDQ